MTLLCSAKIGIVIGNAKAYCTKMSFVTLLCNVYNGVLLEDHKKLIFKCPFSSIAHKNYHVTLHAKKDDARSESGGDNTRLRL